MDIGKITDIKELKALKADQYDALEQAQEQYKQARQNIVLINARIAELNNVAKASSA